MGNQKGQIGFSVAISLVIGMVIGAGVFFKPYAVFSSTGAPGLGIVAWILGGILSIAGGLTAAEVSAAIPKTGGMAEYLKETYGDVWGFLVGWCYSVIYFPAILAALGVIFATQVVVLTGISESMKTPIAIGIILFLMVVNFISTKLGGAVQTISTVCKLIPLAIIIIFGFMNGEGGSANLAPMFSPDPSKSIVTSLGGALVATLFAYDGWISVGVIAGEMKNPAKDLPKAIISGLLVVMAVYISINIAYLYVLPASVLATSETPAFEVAKVLFGANGGKIITVGILISIFGTLNGNVLTGIRMPFAMGTEGKLPFSEFFAKLHPKYGTPVNAGLVMSIIAVLYTLSGQFNMLTDLVVFVVWIFYIMTFIAVFVLRKTRPDMPRPYKVPLYPVVPIIAIIGGVYVLYSTLVNQFVFASIGIGLTVLGLPVYYSLKKKHPEA